MERAFNRLAIFANLLAGIGIVAMGWFFAGESLENRSHHVLVAIFHILLAGVFGIIELIRLKEATR